MKIFKTFKIGKTSEEAKKFFSADIHQSIFLLLFIIGAAAGCILRIIGFSVVKDVSDFFVRYIYVSFPGFDFTEILFKAIEVFVILSAIIFVLGMFLPGQLMLTLISLVQGIIMGAAVCGISILYGARGFGIFMLIILPPILIFLNFQFILMKKSFILSFSIFRIVFYGGSYDIYKKYRDFMIFFIALIFISVLCAAAIALGYRFFGRLFI